MYICFAKDRLRPTESQAPQLQLGSHLGAAESGRTPDSFVVRDLMTPVARFLALTFAFGICSRRILHGSALKLPVLCPNVRCTETAKSSPSANAEFNDFLVIISTSQKCWRHFVSLGD